MKIKNTNTVINLNDNNANRQEQIKNTKKNVSIKATNLNITSDPVQEKRKKARSMAVGLMKEVFQKEYGIDVDLQERRDRMKSLEKQNKEYKDILSDVSKEKDALREKYAIYEGNVEDEELNLLRKANNPQTALNMSKEEREKVAEINDRGLTEYQEKMLRLDDIEKEYSDKITDNKYEIVKESAIIRDVGIERLKQHDMYDAVSQGKEIMKAAGDDIKGMLYEQVKDNIDEQLEEEKEEAAQKKEKEEKTQEQIENVREKGDKYRKEDKSEKDMYEIGAFYEEVKNAGSRDEIMEDNKSLEQLINELGLTSEEIKGIVVDQGI